MMNWKPPLRDQPTEFLAALHSSIGEELEFRKTIGIVAVKRRKPRCSVCGHTGHNVMTCGGRGFPRLGGVRVVEKCDCGRSDCPQKPPPNPLTE